MKAISGVLIKHFSCTLDPRVKRYIGFKHYHMGNGHVSLSCNINLNISFMLWDILFFSRPDLVPNKLHYIKSIKKIGRCFWGFTLTPFTSSPPTYTHLRRPYKHKETCITNYHTSQKLCSKLFKIPALPARRFVIYPFTAVSGAAQRLIYLV